MSRVAGAWRPKPYGLWVRSGYRSVCPADAGGQGRANRPEAGAVRGVTPKRGDNTRYLYIARSCVIDLSKGKMT